MRPRGLLLRGREFLMKDMYTFDSSEQKALDSYKIVRQAYHNIFKRIGVEYAIADADSGEIGGSLSQEFHIISKDGEDNLLRCKNCGQISNEEKAKGLINNVKKITADQLAGWACENKELSSELNISIYYSGFEASAVGNDTPTGSLNIFVLPANRKLNLTKVKSFSIGSNDMCKKQLYFGDTTQSLSSLLNSINTTENIISEINVLIEEQILSAENKDLVLKTLKNQGLGSIVIDNAKLINTVKFSAADLVTIESGDECVNCSTEKTEELAQNTSIDSSNNGDKVSKLESLPAIEIGHIFYLGTKYSSKLSSLVKLQNNEQVPTEMGCYGIGVMRTMQAVADSIRNKNGLVWPISIAPYTVCILPLIKASPGLESLSDYGSKFNSDKSASPGIDEALNGKVNMVVDGINSIVGNLGQCTKLKSIDSYEVDGRVESLGLFEKWNIAVDDRFYLSNGFKLFDSDLVGFPVVVILGEDYFKSNMKYVELVIRPPSINKSSVVRDKLEGGNLISDENKKIIIKKVLLEEINEVIYKYLK
ncbi:Proline-tRNA ligase [Smittium culicis]|uniref:Proline-tRNA ligase n=1 Tax=Smittium culicis TaxID=133412 RepID=A0A1R1YGB3_9FUNG|nr:Proline-tRNA ligase [Smittium culicis]